MTQLIRRICGNALWRGLRLGETIRSIGKT